MPHLHPQTEQMLLQNIRCDQHTTEKLAAGRAFMQKARIPLKATSKNSMPFCEIWSRALIKGDGFCCGRTAVNFPVISRFDKQKYLLGYITKQTTSRRPATKMNASQRKLPCFVFEIVGKLFLKSPYKFSNQRTFITL